MTHHAGCLCGAVRVEIAGEPVRVRSCWCRDCQYWGAGSETVNAAYRLADLAINGEVRWFESDADSGNRMRRGFCPQCGTPLFTANAATPDFMGLRVGALDDPARAAPMAVIWTGSAPPWACIDSSLPQTEGQPPA